MKYYFIHVPNYTKGLSIGDLFNSLLILSQNKKEDKITLLTHKSLVPFVKFAFPNLIDKFVFTHSDKFTRIHQNFTKLPTLIDKKIKLNINKNILNNNKDNLLPNDSVLIILNRSDQYLLDDDIIKKILDNCGNKKVYIRNVTDNKNYKNSFLKLKNILSYESNLMCLIESCIKRKIKIIMNRSGLVDVLGYITKNPIFILFPPNPPWIKGFNFEKHKKNKYLKKILNPNITEYFISDKNDDLDSKLKLFLKVIYLKLKNILLQKK